MATYFHSNTEIQAPTDGLQTLLLMNPNYMQYTDTRRPPQGNHVFLNSATNSPHAPPPHTQQFASVSLPVSQSMDPPHHDISVLHGLVPRVPYNIWSSIDSNIVARETPRAAQQGLSLSLSSQQHQRNYGSFMSDHEVQPGPGEDMRVSGGGSPSSASGVTNGVMNMVLNSKFLMAAKEILEEVVSVGNGMKNEPLKTSNSQSKKIRESSEVETGDSLAGGDEKRNPCGDLSTAERQEIQMKKAKLISMLDEVDQKYRQYHNQMQIVISSFEQAAGIGSAKTYTALALQTISKQFRCLKDAIKGQIRAANKSLGEEDYHGGKIEGSRLKFVDHHLRQQRALQQLGMIQNNAWRPQRGLPERSVSVLRAWLFEHFLHPYPKDSDKHMLAKQTGLTRSQVSNWFINARVRLWKPMVEEMYNEEIKEQEQNDSEDKTSNAEQREEDSASKSTAQLEKSCVTVNQTKSFQSKQDDFTTHREVPQIVSTTSIATPPSSVRGNVRNQSEFSFMGSSELEGITQGSPKKVRSTNILQSQTGFPSMGMDVKVGETTGNGHGTMKVGNERQSRDHYSLMGGGSTNFISSFGQYPIGEIGRFSTDQFTPRFSGNGVLLTLGLPHCENLSMSGTHQTFLPNQNIQLGRGVEIGDPNDFGSINTSTPHSTSAYDNINNIQNRKRFAVQLLSDFVA